MKTKEQDLVIKKVGDKVGKKTLNARKMLVDLEEEKRARLEVLEFVGFKETLRLNQSWKLRQEKNTEQNEKQKQEYLKPKQEPNKEQKGEQKQKPNQMPSAEPFKQEVIASVKAWRRQSLIRKFEPSTPPDILTTGYLVSGSIRSLPDVRMVESYTAEDDDVVVVKEIPRKIQNTGEEVLREMQQILNMQI